MKNRFLVKKFFVILSALMLLGSFFVSVNAVTEIDTDAKVSLSIIHTEDGKAVVGEEFRLYKIASADKSGKLTAIEPFDSFSVSLDGESVDDWRGIAGALESYILRDKIEPFATALTDINGKLTFGTDEKMTPGLYLVGGTTHIQGDFRYGSDPFCVKLPEVNSADGSFIYDVTATPKFLSKINIDISQNTISRRVLKKWDDKGNEEKRPEAIEVMLLRDGEIFEKVLLNKDNNWTYTWNELDSSYRWTVVENETDTYRVKLTLEGMTFLLTNTFTLIPPEEETSKSEESTAPEDEVTTIPDEEELPDTGQLWWPVPVLVSGGLGLIIMGLLRRRRWEDE